MTAELDVGDGWLVSDVSGGVNVTNVTPQLYKSFEVTEIKYRANTSDYCYIVSGIQYNNTQKRCYI